MSRPSFHITDQRLFKEYFNVHHNLGNRTKRCEQDDWKFSTLKIWKMMLHLITARLFIWMIQLMICIKPVSMMHILSQNPAVDCMSCVSTVRFMFLWLSPLYGPMAIWIQNKYLRNNTFSLFQLSSVLYNISKRDMHKAQEAHVASFPAASNPYHTGKPIWKPQPFACF